MSAKPRSLTTQLLLRLFYVAFIVALATETFVLERSYSALIKSFNSALVARAEGIAMLTDQESDGAIEIDFADEVMGDFSGPKPLAYFLVLRVADGSEVERSISLTEHRLDLPEPLERLALSEPVFWDAQIDDRKVRFVALREIVRTEEEEEAGLDRSSLKAMQSPERNARLLPERECLFVVGLDRRDIDKRFRAIIRRTAPAQGVGLVLLMVLGFLTVTRALRPLRVLEREMESISPVRFEPVSVPPVREIASVAKVQNALTLRLKAAFERERQFSADVAHELRTHVSEILSASEVALRSRDGLSRQNRQGFQDVLESALEMQKIILNLLLIARFDANQLPRNDKRVDLDAMIDGILERLRGEAEAKGLTLRRPGRAPASALTDEELLHNILLNLFSNATAHCPEGGAIEWNWTERERGGFALSISNAAQGLSQEDLDHFFERFWRKDKARSSGSAHSGLGLSVVHSLASLLNLEVEARFESPEMLTIVLSGFVAAPEKEASNPEASRVAS